MRKIYLFYLMSLLVLGACQRDDVYMASQMSLNESEQREVSVISVSAAERGLNFVLGDLYADTRSGAVPTIIQTELISVSDFIEEEYRDNVPGYDNKFYLAKIDEGGGVYGTAIMGATPNLPSILAIINNTEFTLEDCRAAWLNICSEYGVSYEDDTRGTIIDPTDGPLPLTPTSDDVIGLIIGTLNPYRGQLLDTQIDTLSCIHNVHVNIPPILKSKLNQDSPYNDQYKYYGYGRNYYAGCVIIALAQIICHNKIEYGKDPALPGIDWESIESAIEKQNGAVSVEDITYEPNEEQALALLCISICNKVYTGQDSSTGATSSRIGKARKFLEDHGYQNVDKREYNGDYVYAMVAQGLPVYVRGGCTECTGAHAWVIDGYYQYDEICEIRTTNTYQYGNPVVTEEVVVKEYETLVHCNMGWGGEKDGYYYHKIFDTEDDKLRGPDAADNVTRSCDARDYSQNNKIITYNL